MRLRIVTVGCWWAPSRCCRQGTVGAAAWGGTRPSVDGAGAAPAIYDVAGLASLPRTTARVSPWGRPPTDTGVLLEDPADRSRPTLPGAKNALLPVLLGRGRPLFGNRISSTSSSRRQAVSSSPSTWRHTGTGHRLLIAPPMIPERRRRRTDQTPPSRGSARPAAGG